jgi:hypothetical protein
MQMLIPPPCIAVVRHQRYPANHHLLRSVHALRDAGFDAPVICVHELGRPRHERSAALADVIMGLYRDPQRRSAPAATGRAIDRARFARERTKRACVAVYGTEDSRRAAFGARRSGCSQVSVRTPNAKRQTPGRDAP